MTSLSRELAFLILQFLEEEKFKETVHKLEQESGYFFNMKYFEEKALAGDWDEVEKYLSGFIKVDDNRYSMKIFFEIRKQKYLEALDSNDKAKALDILLKDLKVFSTFNEDLFKEMTHLLTLDNFRNNEQLSKYTDSQSARSIMLTELKKLIEANPLFRDKLIFPSLKASRLRTLINQSLNWQHQLCKNPRSNPDIKSLFTDHTCSPPPNGARASTPVTPPITAVAKPSFYAPLGAHGGQFPSAPTAANVNALAGWMMNPNPSSSIQSPLLGASLFPGHPNQVPVLKHPRTHSNALGMMDYHNADHEQMTKRLKLSQSVDEVTYPAPPQQASYSLDDIPRTVVCTLHQGTTVTSMDFHPSVHSLLAVGCINGELSLWEAGLRERLISMPFKVKDIAACSVFFQASVVKDSPISVSRVSWSPDGNFIGVAFSRHLIHLYAYQGPNDLRHHLEIDAHVGGVNDLTFSYPNKQLCIVTCGDDMLIKVWDLTGRKLFNFEGHEGPVHSVCPHQKESIQFIFSTAADGKIKAWLYDNAGSRVDYDAPGQWCTRMSYSADGNRLFSCGTSRDGDSFLVEWNESEGALKRTYSGFRKKSVGIVQFDTAKNRFLAAGEDNQIKFWDMDNVNVLTSTDAGGGLPSLPRLRFNKEGNLLAVTTTDGGVKILVNANGMKYFRAIEARSYEASKVGSSLAANINPLINKVEHVDRSSHAVPSVLNGVGSMAQSIEKQRSLDKAADNPKAGDLTEIVDPVHLRTITMPDSTDLANKVVCLLYTNSGAGLLALGTKGIQKLWKWNRNELNPSGKASTSAMPRHWQPSSGLLMTNDVPDNSEEAVPCIALSKNDSYVMSACGGKVSLFNMMTFKVMATFMSPPPSSTILAFHPKDNNIIAVGMEDGTIQFYNVRVDEVKNKLEGHNKRITGLAFSSHLNILVSSCADGQICFWNIDSWDKKKSLPVQMRDGKALVGDTRVQFHSDQVHLLVWHESQLAIYDASKIELVRQWGPQDGLSASISSATYSCNGQLVFAAFADGNIRVFDADGLKPKCRIASSAYLHQTSSNSQNVYPLVIAAHPQESNQFGVGLSDGSVKVIELPESNVRRGVSASVDNGIQNRRTASPSVTKN
ncbi:putative transcription factor WD40-like family [Lupinus albus]|uniref:Putative transcription factor WD40-like family n=1 Tax=Lupinus albus TaxID=3870 RepID=A0A6A4Q9L0_LUPAL|nr:putative transcription factor WD40-like family [Lupinus albus]